MQVSCCDRCGAQDKEYYSFIVPRFTGYLRRTVQHVRKELCIICAQEIWHWLYGGSRMASDRVAVTSEEFEATTSTKNLWP